MSKTTKVLLVISLSCLIAGLVFVTGLINVGEIVGLYATLPAGAIFFGLFLISRTLQGETAIFDAEQRVTVAALASVQRTTPTPSSESTEAAGKGSLAAAHGH